MVWYDVSTVNAGEKIVWACVLRRSIFDYVLYRGNIQNRILFRKAQAFLFGDDRPEDGLNFEEVCGLFAWDPDYIRKLIRSLTRDDIKKLDTNKFLDLFDDDLTRNDEVPTIPEMWSIVEAPVPMIPYLRYGKDFQAALILHRIQRPALNIPQHPVTQWS